MRIRGLYASKSRRPVRKTGRADPRSGDGRRRPSAESAPSGRNGVLLYRGRAPTRKESGARPLSAPCDLIIVDESNSFSSSGQGQRVYLTVVCTRARDPEGFGRVVRTIPEKKGIRSKYSNAREQDLERVLVAIGEQDIDVVESHRRITARMRTDSEDKGEFYMSVLESAVNKAIALDPKTETDILLDVPPVDVDRRLEDYGRRLSTDGRRIRWFETRTSAGSNHLKVHDFVTGAVSDKIEDTFGKNHRYDDFIGYKIGRRKRG